MSEYSIEVGSNLRRFRKLKGYTLADLSKELCCSQSTLSKYENGNIIMDIETLYRLSAILQISPEQLMGVPKFNNDTSKSTHFHNNFFTKSDVFYIYHRFTLDKKAENYGVSTNVLEIKRPNTTPDKEPVKFYAEVIDSTLNFRCSRYVYEGYIQYCNYIAFVSLENIYCKDDVAHFYIKIPFQLDDTTTALYTGISQSMRNPAAGKVIISSKALKIDESLKNRLTMGDSDTISEIRRINALVVR